MQVIQDLIDEIVQHKEQVIVAMIIGVEGSAYRKEGAWMLFKENEKRYGMLSGGCIENDLNERAKKMFSSGLTEIVSYDLSSEDETGWGRGAGCNGRITVLLKDVTENFRQFLKEIQQQLLLMQPVYYTQSLTNFNDYRYWTKQNKNTQKSIAFSQLIAPFSKKAGIKMTDGQEQYIQIIWPKPRLFVIGAGPDARPLAKLASQTGFHVHVIDWRPAFVNNHYFPTANSISTGPIMNTIRKISFNKLDSIVIMTHDFQKDQEILTYLTTLNLQYLGVLGSKKRIQRLVKDKHPSFLYSPAGLSIQADGPEEIAVSIIAQMITIKNDGAK